MRGRRAFGAGVLGMVLGVGSMSAPMLAATPGSTGPILSAAAHVPDPVTFVPAAHRPDINRRMEATIGFGTRGLPGKPTDARGFGRADGLAGSQATRGASAPTPTNSRAGSVSRTADPSAAPTASPTAPAGSAPQGPGDPSPAVVVDAGSPQVTGTIKNASGTPMVGSHACLVDPAAWTNCLYVATSTAGGAFAITAADGTYLLRAWDDSGIYLPVFWTSTGPKLDVADAETITLAGSDRTGLMVTLPPYPLVKGKVTDDHANPLVGMYISSSGYPTDNVQTDANGNYAVRVWPGGSTTIEVNPTVKYRFSWYSSGGTVTDQALATSINVASSDVTGINVTPVPWPKVSGRLTDKNGAGIPYLSVTAAKPYQTATGNADANGYYTVYLYGAGSGWTLTAGGGPYDGPGWIPANAPVQAVDQDSTVNITVHQYPRVAGTVTDSHGQPIQGVTVAVGGTTPRTAVTDASGAFDIRWLEFLYTDPTVHYQAPSSTYVSGVLGPGGFTATGSASTFHLVPDEVLDASVTMPMYGHLTGHMRLSDGSPVSGQWVTAYPYGGGSGQTAVDGSFSIEVIPGSYHLGVPGGWYGAEGFAYYEAAAAPLVLGETTRDIDIVLPADSHISGRVTSGTTSLAGIEVDVYLDGNPFTHVATAADGTYTVAVPPGQYQVGFYDGSGAHAHGWYRPTGYTSDPNLAALVSVNAAGDTGGINVSLPVIRHISGSVVDATYGTVVSQPFVEAFVNGVFYSSVTGSTNGTFKLPVAPGAVTLWIYDLNLLYAPGWRTATGLSANWASAAATTVGSTDVTGVKIKTPEAGILGITVPGPANVEAIVNGSAASFAVSGNSGLVMPVIKGSYQLWIDYDPNYSGWVDGWYKSGTLTPDPAQATLKSVTTSTSVTITLPSSGALSGTARAGQDVDVFVFVNGNEYLGERAAGGGFSFTVPVGTYRLAFADPFGHFIAGWLGPSGFVSTYAAAMDVAVGVGGVGGLDVDLPLGPPPAAPTSVLATPYHSSAGVTFIPPATTADRPLIHFAVTASPGGRQCITIATSCIVTGLTDGTAYTFRVTASSITGTSSPSAPSASTTPKPVPDAPSGVSAITTGSDVQVSWSAPTNNGSAITGYTLTATPGGATCVPVPATQTTCTFHGLTDARYSIAVVAANAHGNGPPTSVNALVDTIAPTVTAPTMTLRSGVSMSGTAIPVTVSWSASDALSGVAQTSLEVRLGSGSWAARTLTTATSTSYLGAFGPSSSGYACHDRAIDASGNASAWAVGSARILGLREETGTGVTYSGTWSTASTSTAVGGQLRYTSSTNASVSYVFTGRGISFVTRKGTTSGNVAVYIDGVKVATLNLYATSTTYRWVAYTKSFSTSSTHTIKIVDLATAGHQRLYVDAFLTIR